MTIDDDDGLRGLERVGRVVAEARDAMLAAAQPGVTTADLDAVGRSVLRRHRARSAPSAGRMLRAGDLVNVDVSAELDGFWADTGASAPVGPTESIAPRPVVSWPPPARRRPRR